MNHTLSSVHNTNSKFEEINIDEEEEDKEENEEA